MRYVIRPVRSEDLDQLFELAQSAGPGMTTLPPDRKALGKRIEKSLEAFGSAQASTVAEQAYLMVMEDRGSGAVVGTSGIFTGVGLDQPFWNFRNSTHVHFSEELNIRAKSTVLTLANDYTGASEVGTLFLHPDARVSGNGAMLARARYLLFATAPERFGDLVIAELRGWLDEGGHSPFWEAVGRHFFQMSFDQADRLNGAGNSRFIADLMPKFPIYADLLPKEAREVIGKPQDATRPAMALLLKEGFRVSRSVDIFDAGPVLEAHPEELRTVRNSAQLRLRLANGGADYTDCLVATSDVADFRVGRLRLRLNGDGTADAVAAEAAAFGLGDGDVVRAVAA